MIAVPANVPIYAKNYEDGRNMYNRCQVNHDQNVFAQQISTTKHRYLLFRTEVSGAKWPVQLVCQGLSSFKNMCYRVYYSCTVCVFMLVMCIWGELQVLEIWDFGSTLKSEQAKPSQASRVEARQGVASQHG